MTADRDALADVVNLRPKRKPFIMSDGDREYHGMFGSCVCDRDYNPATDQWDTIIKTQPECKQHGQP